MSHYNMLYKHDGKRTRNFGDIFTFILVKFSIFWGRF